MLELSVEKKIDGTFKKDLNRAGLILCISEPKIECN